VRSADVFIHRTYLEPNLGPGYPTDDFGFLKPVQRLFRGGDNRAAEVDFDLFGDPVLHAAVGATATHSGIVDGPRVRP
jgi:hypothetical protein